MKKFYDQYLRSYFEDDWTALSLICLFAFFLRLKFLPGLTFDPAFNDPIIDCHEHRDLALQILRNNWRIMKFSYHTPGYAYFVALVYKMFGQSAVKLAIIQYVIGTACAGLVFFLIKRLISRGAAFFGALVMSAYWFLIYTQSHVFSENLSMPLNLLMIWVLLSMKEGWIKYGLAGFLLGASTVVRPEIIPFAGAVVIWLMVKRTPFKKILGYGLAFAAAAAICMMPLLLRNHELSGQWLFRQQIGVNFYMGSLPQYKGSNIYVSVGRQWSKIIRLPFQELNRTDEELNEGERNEFYEKKVFEYIRAHPWAWGRFMAAKMFSVMVGIDFMRSEDVYFYNQYIRGTPCALIQTWLISILALMGMGLSFGKERKKYSLLYLYLAAYLMAMFFTYKTRYLMSHMPVLIIFAAYTVQRVIEAIDRSDHRRLIILSMVFFVLFLGVKWNPLQIVWTNASEAEYTIGLTYMDKHRYAAAVKYLRKAIKTDPNNIDALRHLGITYMQMGEWKKAVSSLKKALNKAPDDDWIASLYEQALQQQYSGQGNSDLN